MFVSINQLRESLKHLESIHPFYGTTFLACKRAGLPVGYSAEFPISIEETRLLDEFYKPAPTSSYYYQVFRTPKKGEHWVRGRKYASSTLQAIRTQTIFANAFIHETRSDWGWKYNYVDVLKEALSQNVPPSRDEPVPAFHLAVWLFRERDWPTGTTARDIINTLLAEFKIEEAELSFFNLNIDLLAALTPNELFQETVISWEDLREVIGPPPDAKPEEGGTLGLLELQGVGPSRKLTFAPAERLNLITGDNGLGKSFLLECSWWALTGQWTEPAFQAYPRDDARPNEPKITIQIAGERNKSDKITIPYDWQNQSWRTPKDRPTIPGLIVYARVDGSFAVWDPARKNQPSFDRGNGSPRRPIVVTRSQVWGGQEGIIEGLLRDWITWQSRPEKHPFEIFRKVLYRLSPPDLGPLEPGEPRRLPFEHREVPTLKHPYGEVPIVHASAGVRRIVTLAYLIVWAWNEHRIASELARVEPQRRMVILVDEMEAHLHPLWQRAVLPALLDVGDELSSELQAQFLVATHSPLVMASVELTFDKDTDKLFHMDLSRDAEVSFRELRFIRYGSIDAWLTSEVFDLRHARSLEAERAIEKAKALQRQDDPTTKDVKAVSEELMESLAANDEFWPRWLYFAEQHGVKL